MSTEPHNPAGSHGDSAHQGEPFHGDVAYESRDIKTGTIYTYLIILAVAVILSYGVCIYIFRMTTSMAKQFDTQPPPIREMMGENYKTMPPEPRLQGVPGHDSDAQYDLRTKVAGDTRENEKLGWVDETNGIAQIPVKDAMKIIAEKGLPPTGGVQAKTK